MAGEWCYVPLDLVNQIAQRLTGNLCDIVKLSAVCKPWRALLTDYSWLGYNQEVKVLAGVPTLNLPKLMLPAKFHPNADQVGYKNFIEVSNGQEFRVNSSVLAGQFVIYWGSGHGWLVTLIPTGTIHLINPVTREMNKLPVYSEFGHDVAQAALAAKSMSKAIIVGEPGKHTNWWVAAIASGNLFWVRPAGRNDFWSTPEYSSGSFTDITCMGRTVYVVKSNLHAVEAWCMFSRQRLWVSTIGSQIPAHLSKFHVFFKSYFLQVDNVFLGVIRPQQLAAEGAPGNGSLVVFRLENRQVWAKTTDLGDCCLFLGDNTAMALSPVPLTSGFLRNCVYFTRCRYFELEIGDYDWSVYSLDDGTYQRFSYQNSAEYLPSPSLWVTFNPSTEKVFSYKA